MAVIMITDRQTWYGSASILKFIAEKLDASGLFPAYRQRFLNVEAGWQALDISGMSAEERAEVKSIVSETISKVRAELLAEHGVTIPFSGLLARLTDLYSLLEIGS